MPKPIYDNSSENNLQLVSVLRKSIAPFFLLLTFSLVLLLFWCVFSYFDIFSINHVQKFSKDAWELLSFISTFLQGTVGISITVTGVLVTWQLARSTLKTAEAVVDIEKQRYARESQEIAREIRHEFLLSSGDFFKVYDDLLRKVDSILFQIPVDVFCARHLVRVKIHGHQVFSDSPIFDHDVNYREELARTVKGLRLSAEHYLNFDDYPGYNHDIAEKLNKQASAIEDRLASGVEIKRFVDGLPFDLYGISDDWVNVSKLAKEMRLHLEGWGREKKFIPDLIWAQSSTRALAEFKSLLLKIESFNIKSDSAFEWLGRAAIFTKKGVRFTSSLDSSELPLAGCFSVFSFSSFLAMGGWANPEVKIGRVILEQAGLVNIMAFGGEDLHSIYAGVVYDENATIPLAFKSLTANEDGVEIKSRYEFFCEKTDALNEMKASKEKWDSICDESSVGDLLQMERENTFILWKDLCMDRLFPTVERITEMQQYSCFKAG